MKNVNHCKICGLYYLKEHTLRECKAYREQSERELEQLVLVRRGELEKAAVVEDESLVFLSEKELKLLMHERYMAERAKQHERKSRRKGKRGVDKHRTDGVVSD